MTEEGRTAEVKTAVFAITAVSTSVKLDETRRASTSFTVSNQAGVVLRGRANVESMNPLAASWLAIAGDIERDFPVGTTQQYTVQITVPETAPAGGYSFRLDAVDVQNTDEHYVQGPSVAFQVPRRIDPPPNRWWIVVAIAAVVIVIGAVLALLGLRNVSAPDVVGRAEPDARATVQASGMAVGTVTTRASSFATSEVVVSQAPAARSSVPRGSAMQLVVMTTPRVLVGPIAVALARGQSLDLDTGALTGAPAADVQFMATQGASPGDVVGRSLQPATGAKLIGGLPASADHDDCLAALESVSPGQTIAPVQAIQSNQVVCVQTQDDHISRLQITAPLGPLTAVDTALQFTMTTWDQ
jgi:hypothetical protein